jgi:hypothetical protein
MMTLNSRQQRAIDRVLNYFNNDVRLCPENYSITHEVNVLYGKALTLNVNVKRIDCDEFSPRAILCQDGGQFFIGARGAITVSSTHRILGDKARRISHLKHLAFMLHGKVQ